MFKKSFCTFRKLIVPGVKIAAVQGIVSVMVGIWHTAYSSECLDFKFFSFVVTQFYKDVCAGTVPACCNRHLKNEGFLFRIIRFYSFKIFVPAKLALSVFRKPDCKLLVLVRNVVTFKPGLNFVQKRIR